MRREGVSFRAAVLRRFHDPSVTNDARPARKSMVQGVRTARVSDLCHPRVKVPLLLPDELREPWIRDRIVQSGRQILQVFAAETERQTPPTAAA